MLKEGPREQTFSATNSRAIDAFKPVSDPEVKERPAMKSRLVFTGFRIDEHGNKKRTARIVWERDTEDQSVSQTEPQLDSGVGGRHRVADSDEADQGGAQTPDQHEETVEQWVDDAWDRIAKEVEYETKAKEWVDDAWDRIAAEVAAEYAAKDAIADQKKVGSVVVSSVVEPMADVDHDTSKPADVKQGMPVSQPVVDQPIIQRISGRHRNTVHNVIDSSQDGFYNSKVMLDTVLQQTPQTNLPGIGIQVKSGFADQDTDVIVKPVDAPLAPVSTSDQPPLDPNSKNTTRTKERWWKRKRNKVMGAIGVAAAGIGIGLTTWALLGSSHEDKPDEPAPAPVEHVMNTPHDSKVTQSEMTGVYSSDVYRDQTKNMTPAQAFEAMQADAQKAIDAGLIELRWNPNGTFSYWSTDTSLSGYDRTVTPKIMQTLTAQSGSPLEIVK